MSEQKLLRSAVRSALAIGATGSLVGAGVAFAQTAAPASSTSAKATRLSNIVVTGSHIPRTSIATAQPVITIDRQEINNTGFTTIGGLLQNLSSAGSALNVQFNNGGNGMQLINLHDLGANRVLVLVNGQRWIPTLSGAVDLTTIPLSVVDRVEVLLDGASSVYGSDAIAGVINIITKKNYNGAEAHAYYGMYDGHGDGGGWDGKTQQYSFTVGTSGDRSGVLLSAGYYQQKPIWAGQRTLSKEPYIDFGIQNGSPFTPQGNFWYFGPSGTTGPGCSGNTCYTVGPFTGPNANPQPYNGFVNNYNYAPANYLRTPQERWYLFSQGHYDLTNNVSFTFTTTYQRRNSVQALAPEVWFFGAYANGVQGANGLPIGISGNNMYNPFGVDLVPAFTSTSNFNAWCARYGSGPNGTCNSNADVLLLAGFQPTKAGNRIFSQNNQTFYFNAGLNGYFDVGGNEWNWSTNYIYGQTLRTDITQGLANTARLQLALGPSNVCDATPGCVPLNLFGGEAGFTPAMLNYVQLTTHSVTKNIFRDYNANIAGSFFNSWYAGSWSAAIGYEYDQFQGAYSPDALVAEGNTVTNVSKPTRGSVNTNAEYAELNVPLAHDAFLAKDINIDIAQRYSQFHWVGIGNIISAGQIQTGAAEEYAHAATPRVTFKWQPIASLLIRGTWAQGFRTPSISELFSGAGDNFPTIQDPCATSGTLPAGCNGIHHVQPASQIHTTVGGSANLEPEKSTTHTVGFVYSPAYVPGFDFSADYFKTEVTNIIARQGGQFYLNQCYIDQNSAACGHIVSTPNGQVVTNIFDLNGNGGLQKVEGWDINTRYVFPTTPIGDFTAQLTMNFMQKDIACNALGQCTDYAGTASGGNFFGQPLHRYDLTVDWDYGPWAATYRMRVIGSMWENCTQSPVNGESTTAGGSPNFGWCSKIFSYNRDASGNPVSVASGQNHIGTTVYSDIQASYTVASWNTTFTLGVNNLFDKEPPISRTAFANSYLPVYYDTPGRFIYGRISVRF